MALSILDGTQTATTLSTILSSGQHITAHTVVSLGTQAKTDILSAVSSGIAISGTVTANVPYQDINNGINSWVGDYGTFPISGTVTIGSALPAGTNRIGVVTIGGGTVTIGAGTAQIGSVTASLQASSITGSLKSLTYQDIANIAFLNTAIGSLPALAAGTAQIGSVTASLAISSTAITSGNFTSLTSATLVPGNVARTMATVYNLGAGQLFVNAGASATTLGGGFMVALSSGDFFECDYTTTTLSAIFATAGTASWVSH